MRVTVSFQDELVEFEVPDPRLVGSWAGPAGVATSRVPELLADALEHPRGFPPLRQAVVPGDRVAIAFGSDVPEPRAVLEGLVATLIESGVAPEAVTVLVTPGPEAVESMVAESLPGVSVRRHDPEERTSLAYLAATSEGRRIYLNRALTDADLVVPVGRLAYDPFLGHRGPWSVIFPGLSEKVSPGEFPARGSGTRPDREKPPPALGESSEVSWLLGCQFQLGLIAGVTGLTELVAGIGARVVEEGTLALDRAWSFTAEGRAELVVIGLGRPGEVVGISALARGLDTARRLVQRGGKIVVLSRAEGVAGRAVERLGRAEDPRAGLSLLKGHDRDEDYADAVRLARVLAWADVYLLSRLDPDLVESLSMIALERPEEGARLATLSGSCLVVSQAEHVRAGVLGEAD